MAANPIYIESEEEIPEVVERLRMSSAEDVPIVLPARSRLGQSRFNFQLLRQYAARFNKRITIISPEPAVQKMAEESGLQAFSAVSEYGRLSEQAVEEPPSGRAATAVAAVASRVDAAPRGEAASRVKVAMRAPDRLLTRIANDSHPGRFLLFTGVGLVLVVALLFGVMFIPAASVTLIAEARPFSQEADVAADPGKAPIRVRVVNAPASSSQGFKATGQKYTPPTVATGSVVYSNNCNTPLFTGLILKQGQRLSNSNGVTFAQASGDMTIKNGASATAQIVAAGPGIGGNVGDHTITQIQGNSLKCLTVTNPQATGGGADEVRETQISQADYDAGRAQLEQQLRQQIQGDLAKQAAPGETLGQLVNFQAPDANTDHKVGETVGSFNMQMTLRGEGAFFFGDDVRKAIEANLAKKVPADSVLTDNKLQTDYQMTEQDAGGHLVFHGKAQGYVGPKIDFDQVRAKVTGRPLSQARSYLLTLPVQSVVISEKPFALPLMPMLTGRIDIKYVVQTAPANTSG